MMLGAHGISLWLLSLLVFVTLDLGLARLNLRSGYSLGIASNPISRVYFENQRGMAARSVVPVVKPINIALIMEQPVAQQQKYEIALHNDNFGLNKLHKPQDSDTQPLRLDFLSLPSTNNSELTMQRTMKHILHRIRY